ncbi:MAG: glycerol kinase GlpK [Firmicutes bacterium]|nr:glycerol kinase GlpK [Bacillota bacterium]
MDKYIMALDQGTTSSRCIIYDKKGDIVSVAQQEFEQIYPEQGWVEHDANEIWSSQMAVAFEAILKAGLTYKNIEAIGITNQRETTVVWDKTTGEPIYNAIVWQCRRTADYCDELKCRGLESAIKEKTGLIIDPYFSGTKLRWILENVPSARERAENGELLFGTIETWLIWKMTGGTVHITDYSNASRTMMFNIHTLEWDDEILKELNIPKCMLPKPCPCSEIYGETKEDLFGGPIRIAGAAGDQQAALFGQTCFKEGEAKSTYGTGNFLLLNTGEKPIASNNGLLTTIAWGLGDAKAGSSEGDEDSSGEGSSKNHSRVTYALEGSVFVCGAVIQWIRDELKMLETSAESEDIARSVEDTNGVYIVPAFVGLGAPYWDARARGAIYGLTRGAGRAHIVRAALESIAYQCHDLIKAMEADMGHALSSLYVDGGASANDFLMQFQSDILNLKVIRPKSVETTSLGAAYFAGLATGYYKDLSDVDDNWQKDREFDPNMQEKTREDLLAGWRDAIDRTLSA